MNTVTNPTDFSDCNTQDFSHYFAGTLMVWTLPSTNSKRRAFLVGDLQHGPAGDYTITGQYLTKLKEWKTKSIKFPNWFKVLQPVSIRDMYFRCGRGVSLYQPNLSRAHGALKKSVRWNYQGFTHFGAPEAEDVSTQGITWWAFRDLYEPASVPTVRSLSDILLSPATGLQAEVSTKGFIVDRSTGTYPKIFHRNRIIAQFRADDRKVLPKDGAMPFMSYMQQVEGMRAHGFTFAGAT